MVKACQVLNIITSCNTPNLAKKSSNKCLNSNQLEMANNDTQFKCRTIFKKRNGFSTKFQTLHLIRRKTYMKRQCAQKWLLILSKMNTNLRKQSLSKSKTKLSKKTSSLMKCAKWRFLNHSKNLLLIHKTLAWYQCKIIRTRYLLRRLQ